MRSLRILIILVSALALGTMTAAQEEVEFLKSTARRLGGSVTSKITVEPPRLSLRDLAQMSDLIIRARLTSMTTRLSDDESVVFRDFTVVPIAVCKQPQERVKRPVPPQILTLRQLGGSLTVDGLRLNTDTNFEDRESPMVAGQEYVLFLTKAAPSKSTTLATGTGVYQLTSGHFGVYPIRDGKIVNFTKWLAQRTDGTTDDPDAFVALIRDLAKPPGK